MCHDIMWILFLCPLIFVTILGLECQLKEESIIGTVLTDSVNGRPCNVLQKRTSSFNNLQISSSRIIIKILPSQENRISTYFEIIDDEDLRFSTNIDKTMHLKIGDLQVKKVLDRESLCTDVGKCCDHEPVCWFELKLLIRLPIVDGKSFNNSPKFGMSMNIELMRIKLIDINDNSPQFSQLVKVIEISESVPTGVKIPLPLALDPDSRVNNILNYRLENNDESIFTLVQDWSTYDSTVNQIYIKLLQPIDRENNSNFIFNLIATDKGKPPLVGKLTIEIKILDANDNYPIFENSSYSVNIRESELVGHLILLLKATDKDSGENGNVMYFFPPNVNLEVRKKFQIDPVTGWLSIAEALDYEKVKFYTFIVMARDSGVNSLFSKTTVKISVIDTNDNAPKIYLEYLTESGKRNLIEGPITSVKEYAIILVSDPDSGNGGLIKCELKGSLKFELVQSSIREISTLKINLIRALDYEEKSIERLNIICHDLGEPQLTSTHDEEIIVQDINDNAPVFDNLSYHYTIDENNQVGVVLLKVQAIDRDSGLNGKITYSLDIQSTTLFSISPNSGIIRSKISFDREKRKNYQILVTAKDSGEPSLSGSTTVSITVFDLNDNIPYFQGLNADGSYIFEIKENRPSHTAIGKIYAEDPDEGNNGNVLYTFISPSVLFSIDQHQGIIKTNQKLDRETNAIHELLVKVTDKGLTRQENSVSVTISVIDVNDNEPRILFPTQRNNSITISYLDTAGVLLAKIEATDKDEGLNSLLEYQIISGNSRDPNQERMFYIDQKNGDIILQRTLTRQDMGAYVLKIMVSDQGNPPLSSFVNFVIKVDNSAQRHLMISNYKYNQNQMTSNSDRTKDDSLSTSVILIVSIALICVIVLVLLTLAVFLCGKRGQEELNEILFKRSERSENSTNLHFCFCLSKSRSQRKLRTDSNRYSEMLYNNSTMVSKTLKSSSEIDESGFRKDNNFTTLYNRDKGNSTGSLLIDKNPQAKGMECQSFQMSNFRNDINPECGADSRYISFQGTTDARNLDEYTTLVNYKLSQPNYEKIQQRMDAMQSKSPSSVKNGHPTMDPIVYIRCHSTPGKNDQINIEAERTLPNKSSFGETVPTLYHQFRSGDIICPISTSSQAKPFLTSSRIHLKNRHSKPLRSQFRYPSVPESLNYLSVGSNSTSDPKEYYDRLQNHLITLDFGKKIKSTPLHRGSFV